MNRANETDELKTAYRETFEETGLSEKDLKIFVGTKRVIKYKTALVPRKVTYWLAELKDPSKPINISKDHRYYKWLDVKAACQLVGCPDMKTMLHDYDDFIDRYVIGNDVKENEE